MIVNGQASLVSGGAIHAIIPAGMSGKVYPGLPGTFDVVIPQ